MSILSKWFVAIIILGLSASLVAQDVSPGEKDTSTVDEDLSNLWLNTVWKTVEEITTETSTYDVEKVTTVAGVRGKEAEDEATRHLYYRGKIAAPTKERLQEAVTRLESAIASGRAGDRVPELTHYLAQCYIQLGDKKKAEGLIQILKRDYSNSKWTETYQTQPSSSQEPD